MARGPRIVAELGRPETADETAARKAASSAVYRSSQTARNLIAALLATLAVVALVMFLVPRGDPAPRDPIDVAVVAAETSASTGHLAVAPELSEGWVVNAARIENSGSVPAWTIVYAQENTTSFVRVAQGLNADESWAARVLAGATPDGTLEIDGVAWTTYSIPDPSRADGIATAISTVAGDDTIIIYGAATDADLHQVATSIAPQVLEIERASS